MQRIPLQLSSLYEDGAGAIHLDSIGLADVDEAQRERIQALLEPLLPVSDAPLGFTKWAEQNIEIISSRPIKQKYYPVSRKLEGEMHEHVRQMLEVGIVVKSNSEWWSPVAMHLKSNGKYRFCIDFRKLNAITKACGYSLPQMDAIRIRINSYAKGGAKSHRFYGAWHEPLRVHSDAIWRCRGPSHVSAIIR